MEPHTKRRRLSEVQAHQPDAAPANEQSVVVQQEALPDQHVGQQQADVEQSQDRAAVGAQEPVQQQPKQQQHLQQQQQQQHQNQQQEQQQQQQMHAQHDQQQEQQQQQHLQQQQHNHHHQQQQNLLQPPSALGAYTQREEHLQRQEALGEIEFAYVVNDGTPINMKRLMGLKVIFSKQLPNMPKEYICRLLLDRRHRSVALVSISGAVLGGITYRVFGPQGLGEIAFCAVAANQQVRGFGTRLMNHTKAMARDRDSLTHFLTYADNNAVGYFTKQGFTKEITMPREQWVGFIKDYDGGTLMEYVIHPKIPYADLVNMFKVQREYLDTQIRGLSNSHVVQPGIKREMVPLVPAHTRIKEIALPLQPDSIPGVKEAGWSAGNAFKAGYRLLLADGQTVDATIPNLHTYMGELLTAVEEQKGLSWPFLKPVDPAIALDYYEVVIDPVDLSLMRSRLDCQQYYVSLEMFVADMRKMCDNCRYYNMPSSDYYQIANKLQAFVDQYLATTVVAAASAEEVA